jgi:cyclohexa-1,5-dienecarbonyl-CoA hydratase
MSDTASTVELTFKDDVAYVTLNAPPLNILTASTMEQLENALSKAVGERHVKAVALASNGKAFSAGADIGEHAPEQAPRMIEAFSRLFSRLGSLELPLVIAVDGAALGAGFELALLADVLLATERATFGQPEIRLGFFAPVGVAYLPRLVGPARAMEITCTGRTYSAQEMLAMGLVARVVPPEELTGAVESVLGDLRRASPLVMRMNVRMLRTLHGRPFEEARRAAETVFLEELMATDDVREGIASFLEKRRPAWKNS